MASFIAIFSQDMLLAGTDTSSNTVEWAITELLRHPECMQKLQGELDAVVGKERVGAEADIPNMPYLRAVVKEISEALHSRAAVSAPRIHATHHRLGLRPSHWYAHVHQHVRHPETPQALAPPAPIRPGEVHRQPRDRRQRELFSAHPLRDRAAAVPGDGTRHVVCHHWSRAVGARL